MEFCGSWNLKDFERQTQTEDQNKVGTEAMESDLEILHKSVCAFVWDDKSQLYFNARLMMKKHIFARILLSMILVNMWRTNLPSFKVNLKLTNVREDWLMKLLLNDDGINQVLQKPGTRVTAKGHLVMSSPSALRSI